ncbi:3-isopropylmalate dehydrogenase [Arthrobacter alpinus]|uniref:3-isopropylmalate dehydrogenase n=1 Tax=Arthrobacter alpinus TaxID=656366 RepID=A0A0M4QQ01_9MICC|nr:MULTISPECIES: isocitrate/isopropylmalate family dehydrogenase [Arthrobacter]ALE92378.1 3-isopropylmalate dehydrogenase [Arthrobacter alpinus]
MKSYLIGLIPGDGIGPELIDSAVAVLNAAAAGTFTLDFRWEDGGAGTYLRTGSNLGAGALERIRSMYHATLKGPAGLPGVRSPDGTEAGVLGGVLRRGLDAYANIRPVRSPGAGIDYVLVRENTEGLYASRGCGVGNDWAHSDQLLVTRPGTERIVRKAFELATVRTGAQADGVRRVTCVDKSNVLRSYALFRKIFTEIAAEYPFIEADYLYADAAAYQLIICPGRFDVLVTENFIGDILSDVGAATAGGLGMCPAANIGASAAYFEPAHGSAPALARTDSANPTAQILAAAMLLEFIGEHAGAQAIRTAVDAVVPSANPEAGGALSLTGSLQHLTGQLCRHISRHHASAAPR